jgi:tRNA-splicing ligase RtcB
MKVIATEKIPIKVWADKFDPKDEVFAQARNLANHPIAREWVCLMPDFHLGYGMPIGGVLATEGGVIPNAVGVDIGCGMIAARTETLASDVTRGQLQSLREAIYARVPVGMKHHEKPRPLGADLAAAAADLPIVSAQLERATTQIGTLGSGNHFIELQCDADGRLWVMLHSGSRNVGLKVCNEYHGRAKTYMRQFASAIPHEDLSFLPHGTPEYATYLAEMAWCMQFAEENRKRMFEQVLAALVEVLGSEPQIELQFDTQHNFAQMEHHRGRDLLVHRKGAVKAEGLVTIPGSMGTASYIGEGLTPAESFNTCSHGAGRAMGRKEANRTIAHDDAVESMRHVVYGVRNGEYDEMPACYKDIDSVMAYQADLVKPVYRLDPLAVVKG